MPRPKILDVNEAVGETLFYPFNVLVNKYNSITVGIAGASLTLIFTISTVINKSLLQVTKKRIKKHNKIMALAKSKLSTIDTL